MTEIFGLKPQSNPLYGGTFDFERLPSLFGNRCLREDFNGIDRGKFAWKPNYFATHWDIPEVVGDVAAYEDYPADGSHIPVFSERAVTALGELLEMNGELLPLKTDVGRYYAFNILTKSTALDLSKSKGRFAPQAKETALSFDNYVFDEQGLEGYAIFRLREEPVKVFVTAEFKECAAAASLNSMEFVKVWPIPEGQNWIKERKRVSRMREEQTAPLKAQAVFVSLALAGKEATDEEDDQVTEIGFDLSRHLAQQRKTEEDFIGNVLHFDQGRKAALIVLVSPDADRLAEVVVPWAASIAWPRGVSVIKHYGEFSERAKKARIKIK